MNWLPWSEALALIDLPPGYTVRTMQGEHVAAVTARGFGRSDHLEPVGLHLVVPQRRPRHRLGCHVCHGSMMSNQPSANAPMNTIATV